MDDSLTPEVSTVEPQAISEETKKKSFIKPLLLILLALLVLLIVGTAYLYYKNGSEFLNVFNKKAAEEQVEETGTKQVLVSGTLSYPAENLPAMKVCAVNKTDNKETCTQTTEGQSSYTLSLQPGDYLIYASVENQKAYYTACDTYTNSQEDPRCNSNFNDSDGAWYSGEFVCYSDTACKAAFTPLTVTVIAEQPETLEKIVQGWYIPCSHETTVCNNPTFDVWSDYIK